MSLFKVRFVPDHIEVSVEKGTTLLSAALSARIPVNASCGGNGVCGRCRMIVRGGEVEGAASGRISKDDQEKGIRLACQSLVLSDLEVEVPVSSRLEGVAAVRSEETMDDPVFPLPDPYPAAPLVEKYFLELPVPDLNDKVSDLERVMRALEGRLGAVPVLGGLSSVRQLGALLRASNWRVTATVLKREGAPEILAIEAGDRTRVSFGVVFDIGTTTISGELIELASGRRQGTVITANPQAAFGADVITRIIHARSPEGLEELHRGVISAMNGTIDRLCAQKSVDLNDVVVISVAGNTTMTHLLLKIDPSHIRQEPYIPTANFIPTVKAVDLGLCVHPHAVVSCLPGVASYVGGDITAGILACGMSRSKDVTCLIDIGTNGEIALGNSEWMISCAASAGPAFEGSGMTWGVRAVMGAIQDILIADDSVTCATIGGVPPRGICGSGFIRLVSQMLKAGLLDKNGKINAGAKSPRVRRGADGTWEFVVVSAPETGVGADIVVTDADLDNLKRAKAAIYSALSVLVRHMGLSWKDVTRFYIAGGFGTSLDIEGAVSIGLIPDLERSKFVFVGNSSLTGARMALVSRAAFRAADALARDVTYFELSTDPAYMEEYMAALFFPHTDAALFPSVRYVREP